MSLNYADGLSPYPNKGQVGLPEKFDNSSTIATKVEQLAKWINKAKHVVLHTGAGISTSAGIPDFRGPRGVWTLEAKGQKPDLSKDFNEAVPTFTHMAVARLVDSGKVKYVVSQNIDGLHLRSGIARKYLSELHGNMFIEQCNACNRQFVRNKAVPTVGQKSLNKACPTIKPNGRACRGRLHDSILDWEHSLPENDLAMADFHSCMADLSIAIGTTMQIVPSGSLPVYTKRAGGKLVIINLQPTKHDKKADLIIHGYADEVMTKLMKQLSLRTPKYAPTNDPTRLSLSSDRYFDWTITDASTAQMRKLYEAKCGTDGKKIEEVIDEDEIPLGARIDKGRKRKSDEGGSGKKSRRDDGDSDLEVVDEIPRSKRGRPKKNPEAASPTKLTIKKAPGQTKYEIVKAKKPKVDVEIVRDSVGELCGDLEMVCESDDDGPFVPTTNFRRYLHDDKTFKREEKVEETEEKNTEDKPVSNESSNADKPQDSETSESQEASEKVKGEGSETASGESKPLKNSEDTELSDQAIKPSDETSATAPVAKEISEKITESTETPEGPLPTERNITDGAQVQETDEKKEELQQPKTECVDGDGKTENSKTESNLEHSETAEEKVAEGLAGDTSTKDRSEHEIQPQANLSEDDSSGQREVENNDERPSEEARNPANDGNNNRSNVAIENDVGVGGAVEQDLDVQRMEVDMEGPEAQEGGILAAGTPCITGEPGPGGPSHPDAAQQPTLANSTGTPALSPTHPTPDIDLFNAELSSTQE